MNLKIELIRKEHLDRLAELQSRAYPGFAGQSYADVAQTRERFADQLKVAGVTYFGCFMDKELVAAFRVHDFTVNFRAAMLPAGGLGGVAVALDYKRRGIAADIVTFFLQRCVERGQALALLWPFRPDFYRRAGFGYGAKAQRYRFDPAALPASELRHAVRPLLEGDLTDILQCCNAYVRKRHGMVEETRHSLQRYFRPSSVGRFYGWYRDDILEGYIRTEYSKTDEDNFLAYDLYVHDLLYLSRDALNGLMGFLNAQQDQVRSIQITTVDEDLYWLVDDPRDDSDVVFQQVNHRTNVDGTGIMYRVVDTGMLGDSMSGCTFRPGDLTIAFDIKDNQVASNSRPFVLRFQNGQAVANSDKRADVTITTDMEYFSGLIMGSITCSKLLEYGLLKLDDETRVVDIDTALSVSRPPMCITPF